MRKFQLINKFSGYITKPDATNADESILVSGSQNVLINDGEKVESRDGFTLDGSAGTANPIVSEYDWKTAKGGEKNLRSYDDELEFRYTNSAGTVSWEKLLDGWAANTKFQFAPWYSSTEAEEILLAVANNSNIYDWSGGITTFASATAATLTKEGTGTWGSEGFYTAGTRQVRIKDSGGTWRTFDYTGGEGTVTLTGVTPDPTTFTFVAGAVCVQAIRTNTNQPASGLTNDFIAVLNNQVYIGQDNRNLVYVSSNTSFTSYTFSSPRVPGEGANLTLDAPLIGFKSLRDAMIMFCGQDKAYKTQFSLQSTDTSFIEDLRIVPLKIGAKQGAKSQDLIESLGDSLVYVSNEPALRILGDVSDSGIPILRNLSDPIKPDFDAANFSNAHLKFHKNRVYLAIPSDAKVLILQIAESSQGEKRTFWQAPQLLSIRQLADIGGNLYGHSSINSESYKLFDGTDDNGNPIRHIAKFSYRNFGDRSNLKNFSEFYSEFYSTLNAEVILTLDYDYQGASGSQEFTIKGTDEGIVFAPAINSSLGINPLGVSPLGADESADNLVKIHHIATMRPTDFHEFQVTYELYTDDAKMELLAFGPAARLARVKPFAIKR